MRYFPTSILNTHMRTIRKFINGNGNYLNYNYSSGDGEGAGYVYYDGSGNVVGHNQNYYSFELIQYWEIY